MIEKEPRSNRKPPDLLIKPNPNHFKIGDKFPATIQPLAKKAATETVLIPFVRLGEGYAGQVYKVYDTQTEVWENRWIVLKALRPESSQKQQARNLFFRLCFGGNFSPSIDESAVRFGLIWQTILRRGAKVLYDNEKMIPEPIGYFWSKEMRTFVEVHEWIDGKVSIPNNPEKNQTKRKFMDDMVNLAEEMGAYQLSRQYKWWTMLAGANVLEKEDGSFVAVDWRSGIALPFFLPLSPGDIPIIVRNLKKGHFVNFDYADYDRLNAFVVKCKEDFADLISLIEELPSLDKQYRENIKSATIKDWKENLPLSDEIEEAVKNSKVGYNIHLFLEGIPIIGSWLHRFLGSETYQKHLGLILLNSDYRKQWFKTLKDHDIASWQQGYYRITPQKAKELDQKDWLYLLHKVFFSHMPKSIHRLTDNKEFAYAIRWLTTPFRVAFSTREQVIWLDDIIESGLFLRIIDDKQSKLFHKQALDKRMRGFVVDLAVATPLIELTTLPVYPLVYILSGGDAAITAAVAASPITVSGILRCGYTLLKTLRDIPEIVKNKDKKHLASRLSGAAIAPWSKIGTLFVPTQMSVYYPEMSWFLTTYFAIKAARKVPVYGVAGGALEYYAYELNRKAAGLGESLNSKMITIFSRKNHTAENTNK